MTENTKAGNIGQLEEATVTSEGLAIEVHAALAKITREFDIIAQLCPGEIANTDDKADALEAVKLAKKLKRETEAKRKDTVAPLNALTKYVNGAVKPALKTLDDWVRKNERAILAYDKEQKRIKDEAEAAEKKRRDDLAAEEARKAEELRKKAAAAETDAERNDLQDQADHHDGAAAVHKSGFVAKSASLGGAGVTKHAATTTRKVWKWEVQDKAAFLVWVLADPDCRLQYVDVNTGNVRAQLLPTKDRLPVEVPGLRFYQDEDLSVR